MATLIDLLKSEVRGWPQWWNGLKGMQKHGLVVFLGLYWALLAGLGGFRPDQLTLGAAMGFFWYGGRVARTLFWFLLPIFLTGIVYDSQRFYATALRGEVHVAFPYEFDKRFFGIDTPEGRLTPNEFWQLRTKPWLDLVTGFFYLCFIAIYLLICFYHRFAVPFRGHDPVARRKSEIIGNGITWAFFWLNVIGYSTYYWFPAAPPWYAALHGLGPAILDTAPNPAGCLRFDQLLGTSFFINMYARSENVFGAIPSLHIAYPCLAALFAFHIGALRAFSLFFYLVMCFSAVYLNHHYVLDLIWGSVYAVVIFFAVIAWKKRKPRIDAKTAPTLT